MKFETSKKVKLASGEIKRIANVTVPDAGTMFPSVTDTFALKLVQKAINAQGRANAGNALRSLTAGMDEATEARFKSVQATIEGLATLLSGPALQHTLAAVWAVPENAQFQSILDGSNIPLVIEFELTAAQVMASLDESESESETETPSPAEIPQAKSNRRK